MNSNNKSTASDPASVNWKDNLETKDGEMKLLQSDRDRWQQRTQNILQKYDRVDPAELEAMKEKLETLKKERDEAVSARETLEAQASTFPEQLKQAEDRTQELRTRLTEQFKARSKELTGRINAKQLELNSVIQEKEQINQELDRAREELNLMKSRPPETVAAAPVTQDTIESQPPNAPPPEAANSGDVNASEEKIKELEEKAAQPVAGAGVLRALQSGLPVARGGRGRGMQGGPQHGQFVSEQQMQGQQFQQQHAGRGSAISRGRGMRGGGQGRGGAQHIQTGNLPQGAGQASPRGGRGGLNAQARQFIPHGKRARDDGGDADANAGKRMRGGGAGQ
ncbi:hypothetical protein CISG_01089 [Coccidioides immitis RMSCC 3703]|uniref:Uncharacterized protein n=1 Tax=Coccidioides immitis RMSCC 3703 TaxID=454286 RepID=A0A0J8QWA7_COCIT|nr:hypothetical protein CISG_01089 [Coccidioides immitis RMSCC 3703]